MGPVVARDVVDTVCRAIEHLLTINMQDTNISKAKPDVKDLDNRSLYDAFFAYLTGVNEDAGVEFWRQEFEGSEVPQFPILPSPTYTPCADNMLHHEIQGLEWLETDFTASTSIRATWAILAARYSNSSETTFGTVTKERHPASQQGIESIAGSTMATVPVRVVLDYDRLVDELLEKIQQQEVDMMLFEQMGQQRIQRINEELKQAYQFQTLLIVQPIRKKDSGPAQSVRNNLCVRSENDENDADLNNLVNFNEYALIMKFQLQENGLQLLVNFDSTVINRPQANHIVYQFEHILRQILSSSDSTTRVHDISVVSAQDLNDIWQHNVAVPMPVEACVHDLIMTAAQRQPHAPAVCAWDDELTYRQLDELSTKLAHQLIRLGLKPNMTVLLCFEKSAWTPVAMLGVMKAGGVSINTDITQPEDRLRTIVDQAVPQLIVSSVSHESLANRLSQCKVVTVGKKVQDLESTGSQLPLISPENRLYVVFTSGTTGTPKGVIITHSNFCSAIKYQQALGFTSTSRVYDFASYAFDVSWSNALHTLTAGGCLCIPSDEERKEDIAKSIRNLKANYADLTPTVAQFLTPANIPLFGTLNLGGEALIPGLFDHWPQNIRIINAYGPAECTVVSTYTEVHRAKQDRGIGTAIGTVTWVVDPSGKELAAIGTIGELWIEGPLVGQGYLNDTVRTKAAFIRDPPWLLRGATDYPGRHGRLYRTGDLVRYNTDGSLNFIGRKDTQVKIHGQRVELGEVEHHIWSSLSAYSPAFDGILVAEMITPQGSDHSKLVVFIYWGENYPETEPVDRIIAGLNERLARVVPAHMIPSAFIPVQSVPMTASGKIDRRRLRQTYASLSWERIAAFGSSLSKQNVELTLQERQIRSLWARVLNLDPDSIGADDNFLRIGGDSITAMKLIGAARELGLSLKMADIFTHPRLDELAQLLQVNTNNTEQAVTPFSLLGANVDKESTLRKVTSLCEVSSDEIEDIFGCTPLQEGLLALTARRSGDYIAQFVYKLSQTIDINRFIETWMQIIATTPILRTRIVDLPGTGLVQVLFKSQTSWLSANDLEAYLQADKQRPMELGTILTRFGLVTNQDSDSGITYFVWTIHHALYDGWSMPLLLDAMNRAYYGEPLPTWTPFQLFIKHVNDMDQQGSIHFWREQFKGLDAPQFPLLPSSTYHPRADSVLDHEIQGINWHGSDFTASTVIRTAWAILAARYTNANEAVFGAISTGRQAAIQGIEHLMGPTFVTVPVRIVIDWASCLKDLLQKTQQQATQMVPFEQMGLQNIQRISKDAEQSCQFQTLLLVQPERKNSDKATLFHQQQNLDNDGGKVIGADDFSTYALIIECQLEEQGMHLHISFDSAVMDRSQAKRIGRQFEHLLRQVHSEVNGAVSIHQLEAASEQDLRDIWGWNKTVPTAVDSSVHVLIAEIMNQRPKAPAICAWDGELTYEQLDKFSTQLAHRLVKLGVESEMIPLIFEKSKWMPVAMLGTMKAGGVSIAIDATLPQDSLQRIINQAAPKFIVSSSGNETLANQLGGGCKVITVHDGQPNNFDSNDVQLPSVSPNSGLYVVFTSGTTGTPKGVAITHRNFCSAMKHQIESLGFTSQSRVFDFSSYAFDVVWSNLLYTLYVGGCLCIPSDLDRKQDLANSIRSLKATYLDLTPSTAQLLSHSEIPGITNVNLGGETLTEAAFAHWPKHVRLTNTYGPAECTINSTSTEIDRTGKQDRRGIGTAIGSVTWVVANDGRELAAIGAIGELWLEGPIIGQGYFNNLAQTSEAFIENPAWLLRGGGSDDYPGRHGRLYKTGDLVQYNVDGSLTFIGRKDTQVKIHGQRVELGEVEHQILRLLNGTYSKKQDIANPASTFNGMVVAEVIIARDSDQPALVAFIYPGETQARSKKECANAVHEIVTALDVRLGEVMPSYMIPSAFIPLDMVPMLSSDKVDRRRLRELGASLTREHIAALSSSSERRAPRTQHELQMQSLWARVLDLDANSISIDDNFMRVGGDSIKAMRLAALAKDEGLSLLVADILRHPRLVELADLVEASCDLVDQTISPFSLLGADIDEPSIRRSVALLCNTDQIQDIFPCTPFQEGLLAMSARREGDYVARFVQELHPEVDVSRFVNAWDKALAMTPILQTRFINLPGRGLLQVVTKQQNTWLSGHDVSTYIQEDKRRIMGLAEALSRTGIVRDHKSGKVFFIWTVHHALYDGWSVTLLFDMVQRIYHGSSSPPLVPFQAFIKYLTEMNNKFAEDFWKKQFMGLETSPFPALSSPTYHPSADQCIRHQIESLPWSSSNFAASTIIRSAWTILAAKRSGASEAVFGALVSGRQAGVPGIEQMLAPTVATVPMRILLNWNHSIAELLHDVQKQAADMIPFEQMGLQRIRRVSEDARQACQFQTLLVVQPKKVGAVGSDLFVESQDLVDAEPDTMANFSTYALTIECQLQEQGMQVSANFDSCVIEKSQVSRMIQQFEHTLHQLLADSSYTTLARDISILSVGDIHDIWQWNATVPALAETCIHDLITDRQRPHANAIDAWDGKLTYQRLDELSTRLAQHLVELGVEPEMMVPLCFEKSMWMAVAMLGVLKAGGVLVPVDVSQAADRARLILDDIQPSVIVTSRKYKDFARQQGYLTIQPEDAVSEDKANLYGAFTKVSVTPRSAAYVIFTSGSTGKPKGVVVEHGAASTSLLAHGAELGLSQTSRFFQFASHSFDACIMEILTTLVYQGCVCVPSDESRLRQLTESINEMAVNTLFLTPSVARLLQPDQLPTLDTLAIGGELVSTSDTERWMHLSRLLEVYGPTECAILSVMQVLTGKQVPPQTIGRAIGSVAWVVDPENHNNLVPVGAVGELLLEGNILARGYLNNLARTTAAFVEDPPWLLRGGGEQLGRHGRLYKTGDLVRYNEDGTLVCIGRKDTQVKIRGQRVELGEVEYHMRRLINSVHLKHHNAMDDADPSLDILIAAEVITPKDNSQPTLVAFIFPGKTYLRPGDECAAVVRDMVAGLDERLANVLPPHMIPNAYIPLESMLTTTTGKTDRRRLRDIGNSLSRLELASMNAQSNLPKRIPVSDVERKLQQVWARTLNVTTEIGLDDNFFSLGGDSISAMLVSVAARSHGLHVPVNDIMLNNTIAKLASALRAPKSMAHLPVTTIKDVGSRFSLSPIQQFHFDTRPDGPDLLDLPFYLRLTEYKAPHAISDALHALIERHPMLRARFCRDPNGLWAQYVCENTKESLLFRHFENTSESQKAAAIADCRASIDVERGPLFVAALFEDDDEQTLFLSAHHLVIDFVSWRVLFQDIEDFMKSHKFISSPSTSFQEWCIMQHDYASTNLEPEVALNYQPSYPPLDYWDTEEDQPDTEVYVRKQFFLEESTSAAVLGSCSDRLGVRPHEFMMAALLYSYSRVFQDRVVPPVFTEGHGRGAWDESIDLSQTVGWFTTMFPVQVNAKEGDDVLDFVLKTKESLRNMPRQGWSYFASKYLNKRGREIFQNDPIEINFNFLGRFQQLERESSLMEAMPLPADCKPSGMAPIKTVGVFDVTIIIERGQIQADFKYNKRVPHHDKIEAWIRAYEKTVIDVTRTVQSSMGYQPR